MSNDVQLTEAEEMMANKIFHQGWNDVEQLNYLPEEDRDTYEKHFSFDCFVHLLEIFKYLEEHDLYQDFIKDAKIYECVPSEDKEIDYFIRNNKSWAIILNSCRVSVYEHKRKQNDIKMAEIQQEIQNIRNEVVDEIKKKLDWVEEHMGLLKEWEDPRHNQLARESISMVEPFVLKMKTKDTGADPDRVERDDNIRCEYAIMETEGYDHSHIRKTLAEKYDLKPSTIKSIKYSFKDEM